MKRETASVRSNPKKCLGKYHLPGFRFHPTEHELVGFYLKNVLQGKHTIFNVIRMLDLYRYDPWELPNLGRAGEIELFFFVPRDKNGSGRTNRIAVSGFWKATGSDRQILDEHARCIGLRKTLVFYKGRGPRGEKTNWVMKEYRMPDDYKPKAEVVVCRIFRKAASLKWLEQQALNPVEDHPSVDDGDTDDDLDGSNKPHEPDFSSPFVLDKELDNEDGGRGEVSTVSSSESAEWREAKQISVTTKLQLTREASSSVEDNYVAQTELVSSSAPVSDPNVSGDSIDPAFEDFVDDDICEGLSVCRSDSNVSFMDLLHSSTDCSCLDPTLSASLMDGESTRAENRLQLVPDFCMDSFGNEVAFDSNLNLAEKCPLWDLWAPPPNSFNLLDHASSAVKYTFFDSQECL